jgi:hypothetical protein
MMEKEGNNIQKQTAFSRSLHRKKKVIIINQKYSKPGHSNFQQVDSVVKMRDSPRIYS